MRCIIFIFFILTSQFIFAESNSSEIFCDAGKVQTKDWTIDAKGYQQVNYKDFFSIWLTKAEQGDPKYQFYTAKAFYLGDGIDKDFDKALYWYKKSSKQGYPIAKNNLAVMYEYGEGANKDLNKAFRLFCDAAIQGVSVAQSNVARRLIGKDDKKALIWAKLSANNNSEYGKKLLAKIYINGIGVEKDFKKSKDIYLDLYYSSKVKKTRADAALNVADFYDLQNSDTGKRKAFEWYLISAKLGNTSSKYSIGSILYNKKDYKKAIKWLEMASNEGNASAMQTLGNMYRNGWGVKKNLEMSFTLALKAESLGSIRAMFNLAVAYDKGEGVQQDKRKSLDWYIKSAKAGDELSMMQVASKYLNGDGVGIDLKKAAYWFYKSYKNNSKSIVRHKLAVIYFRNSGKGLEDIPNLSRDFIFNELLPLLGHEELSLIAYEVEQIGNIKEAIPLFEAAAEKGNTASISFLGSFMKIQLHPVYGDTYYDLKRAAYWLKKDSKNSIFANLSLARTYFGFEEFSSVNLEMAYKYSSQAIELLNSGLARDHSMYKDKANVVNSLYADAANLFIDQGMYDIAESLIRKSSKKNIESSFDNDDLLRRMSLARLSESPENFESLYLETVTHTKIRNDSDLFNVILALEKLTEMYATQGKHQKAIDIVVNNLEKLSNKEVDWAPSFILKISLIYLEWGNVDKAEEYLNKYKNLVDNTQNEFLVLTKNYNKGSVDFIRGVLDIMKGGNIKNAYAKMQKGINSIYKNKQSNKGLPIAENMMRNFIRNGQFEYAYGIAKPIIEAYKNNLNDRLLKGVKITSQEKENIKNVLSEFIYVTDKSNKSTSSLGFETMQLAAGLSASDALIRSIYKSQISPYASTLLDKLEHLKSEKKILIQEKIFKLTNVNNKDLSINSKLDSIDKKIELTQKEFLQQGVNSNLEASLVSSAQDVIDRLHKKDALLTMLISKERSFVWLVTSNGTYRHHANIGSDIIKNDVKKILLYLDPNKKGSLKFPLESSSKLYNLLIKPFERELDGINRLVISPDSVLSGIPFSILNNSKNGNLSEKLNYIDPLPIRGIDKIHTNNSNFNVNKDGWLINKYAISVVPSVYSYLESEKLSNIEVESKDSFIGIGNPILTGGTSQVSKSQLITHVNTRGSVSKFVSEMTPLPDTEIELTQIAKAFSKADLIFGEDATEEKLQAIDLSQYGVISFATHALVSDDIEGIVEPSLVLTPVNENNPKNDGLLTASEISNLKLNADIVILSACNTASPFGKSNSQGLSGLANSFFNAGARSLLVSYWSVISESAVDITTRIFKPSNKGRSYAHKHRNAVLEVLNNSKGTYKSHPSYWAPFAVIGVN